MGVTVRELNGHMAHSVTYSPDGEVLSVTVSEPRFTPAERALLLAARRRSREPRGPHGLLMSEATDRKNFGRFKVPPPVTDLAAKAIGEAMDEWEKTHGDGSARYLLFRAELD